MARAQSATSPTAGAKSKAAKSGAAKAAKADPKPKASTPSYIERTFRSASQAERCLRQWADRWAGYAALDPKVKSISDSVTTALEKIAILKGDLESVHRTGWVPPKLTGGQALPLVAGTQVWINKEHRAEYVAVFDAKDLDGNLFMDKVVNGKMVIRIGDSKDPKARFFVPKSHLTTVQP